MNQIQQDARRTSLAANAQTDGLHHDNEGMAFDMEPSDATGMSEALQASVSKGFTPLPCVVMHYDGDPGEPDHILLQMEYREGRSPMILLEPEIDASGKPIPILEWEAADGRLECIEMDRDDYEHIMSEVVEHGQLVGYFNPDAIEEGMIYDMLETPRVVIGRELEAQSAQPATAQ